MLLSERATRRMTAVHLEVGATSTIDNYVGQIQQNASVEFRSRPPLLVAPIPIGYQETAETVQQATDELAAQARENVVPTSTLFSINGPEDGASKIEEISDVLEEAKKRHPELAISFFQAIYPEETVIGKIRRDLGSTVLATELNFHRLFRSAGKASLSQIVQVTLDIDIRRLSRQFSDRIHGAVTKGQPFVQGSLRHARLGNENMDKVMFWYDLFPLLSAFRTLPWLNAFPQQIGTRVGGYEDLKQGEDYRLYRKIKQHIRASGGAYNLPTQVRGAQGSTSPRRMYDTMSAGRSPVLAWSSEEFGMRDQYRERDLTAIPDISPTEARRMINDIIYGNVGEFGSGAVATTGLMWNLIRKHLEPTATPGTFLLQHDSQAKSALQNAEASLARMQRLAHAVAQTK